MKFKLVESIDDRLIERNEIKWTDEQTHDIIDMYTLQGLDIKKIAAKYKVSHSAIDSLLGRNNIQKRSTVKKYPVYLNTISYIGSITNYEQLSRSISLEYKPSIKLGDYTVLEIHEISSNLRKRISNKRQVTGSEVFTFYMKLLQEGDKEENIKQLISDILNIDNELSEKLSLESVQKFFLLTIDDKGIIRDNDLVEFYSYQKTAEDWLTNLGSRVEGWAEPTTDSGKYLKELALQYRNPTIGSKDYKKVIEKYSLKSIIYSLFDKHGNKIDPINYKNKINEIPYETEFDVSSLEDLKRYFRDYKRTRDVLYGYTDKNYRVVYVGITQNPYSRGEHYAKSAQEQRAIAKALTTNLINKLIIFKSYLPTAYSESSSKLLRQLEIEFAEKIFKTYYPENRKKSFEELIEAGTLNIDRPGKNQNSYIVNSIKNYIAELAAKNLLSQDEYENHIKSKLGNAVAGYINKSSYSYKNFYLLEYIKNHLNSWKSDLLLKDVGTGKFEYLYPEVTSLEELNELMSEAGVSARRKNDIEKDWTNFHNKKKATQGKK